MPHMLHPSNAGFEPHLDEEMIYVKEMTVKEIFSNNHCV